ncbi:MAG: hypothetical protein HQK88_01975 [Nitrospirae bacterium]|nr:hypothetical protein [Nitrospirota bacterium]MBF0533726.1 hypothetical protein [Nitrospirota bacterium]MBF0615565.1 hypothetical protein [Nitrospirota bacterium]
MLKQLTPLKKQLQNNGFLVIEILISGLILTASIAASMYLFRIGYESLSRAQDSNMISAKMPEIIDFLKNADLAETKTSVDMGDDVILTWRATPIRQGKPSLIINPIKDYSLTLYRIEFGVTYNRLGREYTLNVLRY